MSADPFLEVAVEAARAGGRILMKSWGKLSRGQVRRKGPHDWVTDVDHASERAILDVVRKAFPDHAIQAEESGRSAGAAQFEWLIDPLDGTVNYVHSFPMFAVSVALARDGVLEVGVVYDPVREELFTGERNKGAWLNGKRICVSKVETFEQSLLATGFPFRAKELIDVYLESFRRVFSETGSIRRAGSAAVDLAYTACGRMDGFWEMSLSSWDMAAGALLIQEAGGRVSDFFGGDSYLRTGHIAAANPALHARLVALLAPIFQGKI